MCTYSRSRASKEVSETHHMYLLTVTCNKINELICSVHNSDQEGVSMEADGVGVEAGTAHLAPPQLSSPVSVTTVSDISNVLCTHNRPADYCHEHEHHVIFVPPLCQGPSHGGSYMDEGTSHIRIRLPPHIVSGDCLAFVSCFLDCLLFTCE